MVENIQFNDRNKNHRSRKSKPRKVRKTSNVTTPCLKGDNVNLGSVVLFELSIKKAISWLNILDQLRNSSWFMSKLKVLKL